MHYGVIVDVDYKDDLVRCYDEIGANYERDRNNVQLKHCPPPFTKVSRGVPGKVYAMADMENPVILQKSYLSAYSLQILERGTKVPNADMKKYSITHGKISYRQKEIRSKRRCGLNIVWDDESEKDEDMEF